MRTQASSPAKSRKVSLTDRILTFCASGRYGVKEAIAAATLSQRAMDKTESQRCKLQKEVEGL